MKYLFIILLTFSLTSFSQVNFSNTTLLDKAFNIKLGYDPDYTVNETKEYLYVAYEHYSPGPIITNYTRIRKSDMSIVNTFKAKKYGDKVLFFDDNIYIIQMEKTGIQSEQKSRWNIEIKKLNLNNEIVGIKQIEVPKKYDYAFKPSFTVEVSEDKSKLLISMYHQFVTVLEEQEHVLFTKTFTDEMYKYFFVDNDGSLFVLQEDGKLLSFNANDDYAENSFLTDIPKELITKQMKHDEAKFQIISNERTDFFMVYNVKVKINESDREIYRVCMHFAISKKGDLVDFSFSAKGLGNIASIFEKITTSDKPLIIHLPNEFTIAKFKTGNSLLAYEGEYAREQLFRTNMDRSRKLYVELRDKNGEKLIENYYKIATRGVLTMHGYGVGISTETISVVFNIPTTDLNYFVSQDPNQTILGCKVVDSPKKMIAVMDVFSLEDGKSLYHNSIFNGEEAKSQKVAAQTLYMSKYSPNGYILSNSKTTNLFEFLITD